MARGNKMASSSKLLVLVCDHRNRTCPSVVSFRYPGDSTWRPLEYDPVLKRHFLAGISAPHRVEIHVRGAEGWYASERTVELDVGDNHLKVAIAPIGELFYTAASGARVFFTPVPQTLWLDARGVDIRNTIDRALQQVEGIRLRERAFRRPGYDENLSALLEFQGSRTEQSLAKNAVAETIDSLHGIEARLSAPMVLANGAVEWLTTEIVVIVRQDAPPAIHDELAAKFELEVVRRDLPYLGNASIWRRPGPPRYDILEIARQIAADPDVLVAEPNLLYEIVNHASPFRPTDFLYPEQREMELVQAPSAWGRRANSAGAREIAVAVVDTEGVDPGHPNLQPSILANWDFVHHQPQDPTCLGDDHGTQCASTAVGMFDDRSGTTGLAGGCQLIAARIPSRITGSELADIWLWVAGLAGGGANNPPILQQGADVILNAWGTDGTELTDSVKRALDCLSTDGRGGRGCVVCFSAGNQGYEPLSDRNRFATHEAVITVGASIGTNPTNPCTSDQAVPYSATTLLHPVVDTRAYYSPFGEDLDIVAPSSTSIAGGFAVDPIVSATRVGKGNMIASVSATTQLAAPAQSGATTIEVQSTAGIAARSIILLGELTALLHEFQAVTGVQGNTLFVDPLRHAYPAGAPVSSGARDYSRSFSGTSHAAAMLAGAAALVLSADPSLTWSEVREVLCATADQIDPQPPDNEGRWRLTSVSPNVHKLFSKWYGFGRLNVAAAIERVLHLSAQTAGTPDSTSQRSSVSSIRRR